MKALRLGRPYWLASQRAAQQRYPALRGDRRADVAIVGGGITGAVAATVLGAAGVDVALVDAGRVGRGSTAASTALLLGELDLGLGDLTRRYGAARARRIWQLSADAARAFVRLLEQHAVDCDLTSRDSVFYTLSRDGADRLRAEHERRCRAGFRGEWLTPGALRRLTGIAGFGAILTHGRAQCDPYRACIGLIAAAARLGARVFEHSPVRRIEYSRDAADVITTTGRVRAGHVIVATGYATPLFQRLVGRFQLLQTYVLGTSPLSAAQRHDLGLGDVMLWESGRPYHYARWTADDRLLLGGGDRPASRHRARRRLALRAAAATGLRTEFERLLPALSHVDVEFAWDGLFAMTPDGLPYIGRHSRHPRQLFALGYGGNGMTFAALAARQLLEQLRGESSRDHDLFSFGRLR